MTAFEPVDALFEQILDASTSWPRPDPPGLGGFRELNAAQKRDLLVRARRWCEELLARNPRWKGRLHEHLRDPSCRQFCALSTLVVEQLGVTDSWTSPELEDWATWSRPDLWMAPDAFDRSMLKLAERCGFELPPKLRSYLQKRVQAEEGKHKADHRWIKRARTVLGVAPKLELEPGEAWSDGAIANIEAMPPELGAAWNELIAHCKSGSGSAPSGKWLKSAQGLLEPIGAGPFADRLAAWFPLVDKARTAPRARRSQYEPDYNHLIIDPHMEVLKGFCWIAGTLGSPELARELGRLAISCYRKAPGVGPRAIKVGNGAVHALGVMPGMDSLGQLAMLRVKVKFGGAQKSIEKALNAAAAREGLPRDEIEELGVPTYGLTGIGVLEEELGDYRACLTLSGIGATELVFFKKGSEKPQKSVPAALKTSHAEALKEIKAAAKDAGTMLPAQRDRIDSLFLENRTWKGETWRERYLDHPLVGVISRRLIWRVSGPGAAPASPASSASQAGPAGPAGSAEPTAPAGSWRSVAWLDEAGPHGAGSLVDSQGRLDPGPGPEDSVRLWHPIEVDRDEVMAWRRFFEDRRIRQPFKQAHREVYLLTDAERRTGIYSNRFAAHIIRQHQFSTLCGVRNWKNKLRLMVDDEYPPATRRVRAFELRAEFWVEGAGDEFGRDTNESGAYLHLATDQVRFYRDGTAQVTAHAAGGGYGPAWREAPTDPLPLEQIPALVLSEVLRDVDLFVGVCSVSNNPQWSDGGPGGTHRDYWWSRGFGDLSETGSGRRDLLARLIPRLKIAPVCELGDRFLIVKGKIRTYKIHLGSGNILMEPNDQYLCIVPSSRDETGASAAEVFLPFEGDRTLSIILSKAFMLAEDDKIKDASIVSQIKGR